MRRLRRSARPDRRWYCVLALQRELERLTEYQTRNTLNHLETGMSDRTRIVTPSSAVDLARYVTLISRLLRKPDGHDLARQAFTAATTQDPDVFGDLVHALNSTVVPGVGVITTGPGSRVFANPFQEGWAWQCGTCHNAWRVGTGRPATGVGYGTERGASAGAKLHAVEHDRIDVKEVTW